jgi:hypothetical protein
LRISITIGTAAITRSLSTAAVVQAEVFIDKKKESTNKNNLLVHPR